MSIGHLVDGSMESVAADRIIEQFNLLKQESKILNNPECAFTWESLDADSNIVVRCQKHGHNCLNSLIGCCKGIDQIKPATPTLFKFSDPSAYLGNDLVIGIICQKFSPYLLKKKLSQLERSLLRLLSTRRNETRNSDIKITEVVSYVVLACPRNITNIVNKFLTTKHPLLTELLNDGRLSGFRSNIDLLDFCQIQFDHVRESLESITESYKRTICKLDQIGFGLADIRMEHDRASRETAEIQQKLDFLLANI
jgi:hypothetical protein